jgi:hypothetical protein
LIENIVETIQKTLKLYLSFGLEIKTRTLLIFKVLRSCIPVFENKGLEFLTIGLALIIFTHLKQYNHLATDSVNRHKFLAEFLEVGGVLTVLEILGLKQAKEVHVHCMLQDI